MCQLDKSWIKPDPAHTLRWLPGAAGLVLVCYRKRGSQLRDCLYETLLAHSVGYLDEAGDVGALHVVDVAILLGTILNAGSVDV